MKFSKISFFIFFTLLFVNFTSHSQTVYNFNYTGNQQSKTLPAGRYKLEVWGAQGGGANSTGYDGTGGKGGYSTGEITLSSSMVIYVNVGGEGGSWQSTTSRTSINGGYNGGGASSGVNTTGGGGGGGGATSIASASGILKNLDSYRSSVFIVAGGGGGAWATNYTWNNYRSASDGGAGGGTNGQGAGYGYTLGYSINYNNIYNQNDSRSQAYNYATGGTQSGGGSQGTASGSNSFYGTSEVSSFGLGASSSNARSHSGGGGGGGWYGGGAGASGENANGTGGAGGSGYTSSILLNSNTISGTATMSNPSGGTMTGKSGNGYARITLLCDPPSLTVSSTHSLTYGSPGFSLPHSSNSTGTITYSSSNTSVATIDGSGNVTIIGTGTTSLTLTQAAQGEYCADTATMVLTVHPKSIIINGITANDKVYDSTTSAVLNTDNLSYNDGLVDGDDLTATFTGVFSDEQVGTDITVNLTGSASGADAGNYSITYQLTTTASITKKPLTIDGIKATDRAYNETTEAVIDASGINYNGLESGDDVTATFTGAYSDPNTGTNKTVTLTATYSGVDVGNYNITPQSSTTASITAAGGNGDTFNFTNATASGKDGPTQAQINTAYNGTSLDGQVTINTRGIQEWTVPTSGNYIIKAAGAGDHVTNYGKGAIMQGKVYLTAGQVLKIAVGQKPDDRGGAGGTFVVASPYNTASSPLIVAGGAGGKAENVNRHGLTETSGRYGGNNHARDGKGGSNGGGGGGAVSGSGAGGGGFLGNGGDVMTGAYCNGGGGAGGNGTNGSDASCVGRTSGTSYLRYNVKGIAFVNGATGGNGSSSSLNGGFGGGGGSYAWNSPGGGGGGYSGGGGASYDGSAHRSGGGGGSYFNASVTERASSDGRYNGSSSGVTNLNDYNDGHGYVTITQLCTPSSLSLTASKTVDVDAANFTLAPTSLSSGTITYSSSDTAIATVNNTTGEVDVIASGEVVITASQAAYNYYCSSTATMTLRVNKLPMTVIPSTTLSKTYGSSDPTLTYAVSDGSVTFTGVLSRTAGEAVGTYSYTVGTLSNDTYRAVISETAAAFVINKKDLTIDGIRATDRAYNETTEAIIDASGINYNGLESGDDVTATFTGAYSDPNTGTNKTVTLTATYSGVDVGNYNITPQSSTTASITAAGGDGGSTDYTYTGSVQSVTLQPGNYKLEVWGAAGGRNTTNSSSVSGKGGYSTGNYSLSVPTTVYIYVGGKGTDSNTPADNNNTSRAGGFNGGGNGVDGGAGGGGASDIRIGGTSYSNRIIVAGGAGGVGQGSGTRSGGYGGGTSGGNGSGSRSASGATQSSGNALGIGGNYNSTNDCGGGGGGYYGGYGGSTSNSSGSGGSGYVDSSLSEASTIAGNSTMPDPSGGTMTGRSGHGYVRITQLCDPNALSLTASKTVDVDAANFTLAPTSLSSGTITYSSSDTAIATVNSTTGEVDVIASGEVVITASQAAYNYYCSSTATMTLRINKLPMTVIPSTTLSKTYGSSDPTLTYTVSDGSVTFTGVLSRTAGEAVGTYSYTVGTLSNDTYRAVISETAAAFVINKKDLTIDGIRATDRAYNETTEAIIDASGINYNGLESGDDVTATFTGAYSDPNTGTNKTVTLTATYSGVDVGNYNISPQTTTTASITAFGSGETYVFTNAGSTGKDGPTQAQVNSAYGSNNSLHNQVTVNTQGVQEWIVPLTARYRIDISGARGGVPNGVSTSNGGKGVKLSAELSLSKDELLKVVVGQLGSKNTGGNSSNGGGFGGGGSFLWKDNGTELLLAAGGGGGGSITNGSVGSASNKVGKNGTTSTSGLPSYSAVSNFGTSGGNGSDGHYAFGWNDMKLDEDFSARDGNYSNQQGGFGGGGGAYSSPYHAGGGGGGYSAGGNGRYGNNSGSGNSDGRNGGGGGGSFIISSAENVKTSDGKYDNLSTFNSKTILNLGSYSTGHGSVSITQICNDAALSLTASKTVDFGSANFSLAPTSLSSGTLTYSSSDTSVATVNSTSGEVSIIGAGTATITLSQAAYNYYCGNEVSMSLIVKKKVPAISNFSDITKVYGEANMVLSATSSSTGAITYTSANSSVVSVTETNELQIMGVGSTYVTLSQEAQGIYGAATQSVTISITPMEVSVTPTSSQSKTYATTNPEIIYTTSPELNSTLANSATVTFTGSLSRTLGEAVGTYAINLGDLSNDNYNITLNPDNFEITKKELSLSGSTGVDKIYDTTVNMPDGVNGYSSLSGVSSGDIVSVAGSPVYSSANVGSRIIQIGTVTLTGEDSVNYSLNWTNGSGTISTKTLTVTANNDAKFVTQSDTVGFEGVSYSGFEGAEDFTDIDISGLVVTRTNSSTETAGEYTAVLEPSGIVATNYAISYVKGDFTIVAADKLLLTYTNKSSTYGSDIDFDLAAAQYYSSAMSSVIDLSFTESGLTDASIDDGTGVIVGVRASLRGVSRSTANKEIVGSYPITSTVVSGSSSNFNNVITVTGNHSIYKKGLNLSTSDVEKVYDGSPGVVSITYALSPLEASDVVSVNASGVYSNTNVGTDIGYRISSIGLTGTDAANYYYAGSDPYVANNGVINKRPITIKANTTTKTYGELDPIVTLGHEISSGNIVSDDRFSGTLTRTAGEDVGSYSVTLNTLSYGSNYEASFIGGNLNITPKTLSITAAPKSKAYAAPDPEFTYSTDPAIGTLLANGEVVALSGSLSRTIGENAGAYSITTGTLTNTNYTFSFHSNDLTITKIDPDLTFNDVYLTYGDTDHILSAISSNTSNFNYTVGDSSIVSLTGTNTLEVLKVGTTTVTLTQNTDTNYNTISKTIEVTVNPLEISVTPNSTQSKTYGDLDPVISYTFFPSTAPNSSTITFTGSLSRTLGATVGTYEILLGTLSNTNYDITLQPDTFEITPRPITISAATQSKTYGELDPLFLHSISSGSIVSGDAPTGQLSRTLGEDVGIYFVSQGSLSYGTNYTESFIGSNFEILSKTVTVTADSQFKFYGEDDLTLTYTTLPEYNSDLPNGDRIMLNGSLSRTAGEEVGTYSITLGTLTNTNYNIEYEGSDFEIIPIDPTISNISNLTKTFNDPSFTISPTSDSPASFTYTSTNSSVATIDATSGVVVITGAGSTTIEIGQSETRNFNALTQSIKLTILKDSPNWSFTDLSKTFNDPDFTLTPNTNNSPGLIIYQSSNSNVVSITTATATILGAGSTIITADIQESDNYLSATQSFTVSVAKDAPVIENFPDLVRTFNDPEVTLAATSSSTAEFTYSSSDVAVGEISNDNLTITGAGTAILTATIPSDANYESATLTATLTVNKAVPTMSGFPDLVKTYGEAPFELLTPSTNSPGALTYASSNTASATISGKEVTLIHSGILTLTVSQAETANYTAGTISASLTINKASQAITVAPFATTIAVKDFTSPQPIVATATSGEQVTANMTGTAAVFAGTPGSYTLDRVNISTTGVVTLTFSVGATTQYKAATATMTIDVVKSNQSISYSPELSTSVPYESGLTIPLTATAAVSPVTYLVGAGPATLSATSLVVSETGMIELIASQSGNGTYNPAPDVISFINITQGNTVLTPFTIPEKTDIDPDFSFTGTTSNRSGEILYSSSNLAVATVSGTTISIVGVGNTIITATQASNANYKTGTISTSFTVIIGDTDGDGFRDNIDNCPTTPNADQADADGDGVGDVCDNAPGISNPDQRDTDADGIGDVADPDDDNDGCPDTSDAFPLDPSECSDNDGDGIGDNADTDDDNDGVLDTVDNCAFSPNADQSDIDADGIGDVCDTDIDGDGWSNEQEAQCGSNPTDATDTLLDTDSDGLPNCTDPDDDNDGYLDTNDAFPLDPNEWIDTDADGIGNNADTDDDNDGQSDEEEIFCGTDPLDASSFSGDVDADGITDCRDIDNDNDGVLDAEDAFPLDPAEWTDTDADGIGNNADTDDDGDGYSDLDELECNSNPLDANELPADLDADGILDCKDTDLDGDGCLNTEDVFPRDPSECQDTDGDGLGDNIDVDDDADGVIDSDDAFPLDPRETKDSDGDGIGDNADTDDNNDGFDDQEIIASGVLTPNSSGMESTWKVINIEKYPNARVQVYNRNGQEVYNAMNYRNDWRGTFKNSAEPLPAGSYYYMIDLNQDGILLKGWLYITY